jgi:hypothetical protein
MMTNEIFRAILDALPPKPSRSRLEPYAELIFELHRRGRTYREIARILTTQCNFQTSRSTVNDFVRAHSKRTRKLQMGEALDRKTHRDSSASVPKAKIPETGMAMDEIQRRIADLKRRPTATNTDSQRFRYDQTKPLYLPFKKKVDP